MTGRFVKYLVYGIYVVEFGQTMLVAHDAFEVFGYGFGDMDALTRMNFFWLIGPIMSAVGAQRICFLSSATYHGFSFLCRPVFYAYRIFIVSNHELSRYSSFV